MDSVPDKIQKLPRTSMPIDPLVLDQALLEPPTDTILPKSEIELTHEQEYKNNLYQLFKNQFAMSLREERAVDTRTRLAQLIGPDLNEAGGVERLREATASLLPPTDHRHLFRLLSQAFAEDVPSTHERLIEMLEQTLFECDRVTLWKVLGDNKDNAKERLKEFMDNHVILQDRVSVRLPNIVAACGSETCLEQTQCDTGRLRVPRAQYNTLLELLASDVHNPKQLEGLLNPAPILVRPFEYREREGERLYAV